MFMMQIMQRVDIVNSITIASYDVILSSVYGTCDHLLLFGASMRGCSIGPSLLFSQTKKRVAAQLSIRGLGHKNTEKHI